LITSRKGGIVVLEGGQTIEDGGIAAADSGSSSSAALFMATSSSFSGSAVIIDVPNTAPSSSFNSLLIQSGTTELVQVVGNGQVHVVSGGIDIDTDGLNIDAGGIAIASGGQTIYSGGLTVKLGGVTVESGGLFVDTNGGSTLSNDATSDPAVIAKATSTSFSGTVLDIRTYVASGNADLITATIDNGGTQDTVLRVEDNGDIFIGVSGS